MAGELLIPPKITQDCPSCYHSSMRNLAVLFIHLLATLARLLGPAGVRSLVAESLLLKHQLLILNRSRQRSPNLSSERSLHDCELLLLNVSHSVLLSGIETMKVATAVDAVDVESGESIHRWKDCTEATMHGTPLRSGGVACVVKMVGVNWARCCWKSGFSLFLSGLLTPSVERKCLSRRDLCSPVTAEAAGSSPVDPAILSSTYGENGHSLVDFPTNFPTKRPHFPHEIVKAGNLSLDNFPSLG